MIFRIPKNSGKYHVTAAVLLCYNGLRLRGEVAERLKALVSKTSMGVSLIVGSNPTLSATASRGRLAERC